MNIPSAYPIPNKRPEETSFQLPGVGILFSSSQMDARKAQGTIQRLQGEPNNHLGSEVSKERAMGHASPSYLRRLIAAEGLAAIKHEPEIRKENLNVTHRIKVGSPTKQGSSGRCWIFASLNMLRSAVLDQYGESFAYSQNYIAFWDKVERANAYLDRMVELSHQPKDQRLMDSIRSSAFEDGGEWIYFKNIVKKYGLVPDYAMPETKYSSSSRGYMNILQKTLKEQATVLQKMVQAGATKEEVLKHKEVVMQKVISTLTTFLGAPPKSFRLQGENGIRTDMSPLEFYSKNPINIDDYVEISLLEEEKEGQWIKLRDTTNMVGGQSHAAFNIGLDEGLEALRNCIKDGTPALCMSEVTNFDSNKNLCSLENDKTREVLGLDDLPKLSKSEKLQAGATTIAHAMLFIGCDEADTSRFEGDKSLRKEIDGPMWLVENSWEGASEIFMTDDWVRENLYEILIPKKFLSESRQKEISDPFTPSLSLPNWHYMANV